MNLIEADGRYILQSSYAEREIPKRLGFRWNPTTKNWWTDKPEIAAKVASYATPQIARKLTAAKQTVQRDTNAAVAASWAQDAPEGLDIPCPEGLAYLPYQRAGIAYTAARRDTLIADSMGLGKTVEAIGVCNMDPTIKRVLIVAPASLKTNWSREWQKWSTRPMTIGIAFGQDFPTHHDVVIINYDILRQNRAKIDTVAWDLFIADEAHAMKNPAAERTRQVLGGKAVKNKQKIVVKPAIERIAARRRIFMTGTPILNKPSELWPLVQSLDPAGLGADFFKFHSRYCAAKRTSFGWDFSGASNLSELQDRLRSGCMIRRLKSDVLHDLPPKRRQIIELSAEGAEKAVAIERRAFEDAEAKIAEATARMELADAAEDKEAYASAVADLKAAQNIAFTGMSKLRHDTAVAKIPYIIEHVREAIEASEKVILFVHHRDVVDAIAREFGASAVTLTGQTSQIDRQAAVDRFQTDPTCTLFIGNILAAGVGITLTAASHVLFGELDWRPGIVSQAEDRAHRIGQVNSVLVQHLVFNGSIDATMAKRIVKKQDIIDRALDDKATAISADDDELELAIGAMTDPGDAPAASQDRREPRQAIPATPLTQSQMEAVLAGLRLLVAMDSDRARDVNGIGFSKYDGVIGHSLAKQSSLSPRQGILARKLVNKYRRQLPAHIVSAAI